MQKSSAPRRARVFAVALAAMAAVAIFAAVAMATSTYEYCSGCTINASSSRTSAADRFAVLSYEHRLSGPGSGVQIEVQAFANNGGQPGSQVCSSLTFSTEAACDPGGTDSFGRAWNFGAGNYGFNAHLTY